MKKFLILSLLLLSIMFAIPVATPPARAVTTQVGLVCINVSTSVSCPSRPPSSGPVITGLPSTAFTINVNLFNSSQENGFDVVLTYDNTILTAPTVASTVELIPVAKGGLIRSAFIGSECINGITVSGVCSPQGSLPGTIEFGVVDTAGLSTTFPTSGGLFNVTFTPSSTATVTGTPFGYATGCTGTSVPNLCVSITNGTPVNDPENVQTATFIDGLTFIMSASPTSVSPLAGNQATSTITISSFNGFTTTTGTLASPTVSNSTVTLRPTATLSASTFSLTSKITSVDVLLTVTTTGLTPVGVYTVTVTGTSGTVIHSVVLAINVKPSVAQSSLVSVVTGTDGNLYWSRFTGTWSSWKPLNGSSLFPPALCRGTSSFELVVTGRDGQLHHRSFTGTWSAWDSAGGQSINAPSCAVLGNTLFAVVQGANNNIHFNTFSLSTGIWGTWTNIGGFTTSQPIIVSTPSANRLDVLVIGLDTGLYHQALIGGTPSGVWDLSPDGRSQSVPAVVSDATGLNVVVRGFPTSAGASNGPVWFNRFAFTTSTWSGWQFLNGYTLTTPSLIIDSTGTLRAVVTGLDGAVYAIAKPSGGAFGTWTNLGGVTASQPAIGAVGTNLVVLVRNTSNVVVSDVFNGVSFLGFTTTTAIAPSDPVLPSS